jgi:hypothetical protein
MFPSERKALKTKPTNYIQDRWNYYMTKEDAIIYGREATRRLVEAEKTVAELKERLQSGLVEE